MREIKFRAWDKIKNKMLEWEQFSGSYAMYWLSKPNEFQLEFMQYTGLKDKNGKEIYERDIVEPVPNAEIKYQVKWSEYVCGFHLASINHPSYILNIFVEPFERVVIGNIYENPELLEANNDRA